MLRFGSYSMVGLWPEPRPCLLKSISCTSSCVRAMAHGMAKSFASGLLQRSKKRLRFYRSHIGEIRHCHRPATRSHRFELLTGILHSSKLYPKELYLLTSRGL